MYFLPEKTEETGCIIYVGPGGEGFERKHPIYQGIGIEAPLEVYHDIWTPIEISFGDDWSDLKLSLILNWDLYGRYNKAGFMMLKKGLKRLIDSGWKNEMPDENNPFR